MPSSNSREASTDPVRGLRPSASPALSPAGSSSTPGVAAQQSRSSGAGSSPTASQVTATQGRTPGEETAGRTSGGSGDSADEEDQPCQSCGAFPARFQCSACQSVRYCSQECQADDWKIHYRECAEIIAAIKEEQELERQRQQEARAGIGANPSNGDNDGAIDLERQDRASRPLVTSARTSGGGEEATLVNDPIGAVDENIRATASQPRRRPREPRRRPRLTPEQIAAYEEAERIADMKFYMLQIYKIIKPVVVCICLSILWVKISMAGSDYRPTQSSYTVYRESSTSTPTQNFVGSLANAGIIIGQIVVVTIIIVFLFKRGHIKVLIGFFMVVVAMLLGFMGYILILNLIQVLRIPLDYVTMSFALWNFSVAGLVSVFWKGPMWLQQVYLTVMSSLMAFSLTGLAEWTTWMLLALLVVWDLIAVLCPFGPLKILVESSRNQNQEVPALLYTVNAVWFMASPPNSILDRGRNNETAPKAEEEPSRTAPFTTSSAPDTIFTNGRPQLSEGHSGTSITSSRNSGMDASFSMGPGGSTMALVPPPSQDEPAGHGIELRERHRSGNAPTRNPSDRETQSQERRPRRQPSQRSEAEQRAEEEDDDDDGGGLKLGLGDFVFYSVLIARAAMFDWVTTVCCTVAVLTGMNATIFLLAIYQKALPALPISICFGMLFYFATRFALVPFLAVLGSNQVFI